MVDLDPIKEGLHLEEEKIENKEKQQHVHLLTENNLCNHLYHSTIPLSSSINTGFKPRDSGVRAAGPEFVVPVIIQDNRPIVKITFGSGKTTEALIDSGSSVS